MSSVMRDHASFCSNQKMMYEFFTRNSKKINFNSLRAIKSEKKNYLNDYFSGGDFRLLSHFEKHLTQQILAH